LERVSNEEVVIEKSYLKAHYPVTNHIAFAIAMEIVVDQEEKHAMSYYVAEASILECRTMMFSTGLLNSAECGGG